MLPAAHIAHHTLPPHKKLTTRECPSRTASGTRLVARPESPRRPRARAAQPAWMHRFHMMGRKSARRLGGAAVVLGLDTSTREYSENTCEFMGNKRGDILRRRHERMPRIGLGTRVCYSGAHCASGFPIVLTLSGARGCSLLCGSCFSLCVSLPTDDILYLYTETKTDSFEYTGDFCENHSENTFGEFMGKQTGDVLHRHHECLGSAWAQEYAPAVPAVRAGSLSF